MAETSSQERMQILKMIEDGKITPEDGAKLLEALRGTSRGSVSATAQAPGGAARWLVVRVTDMRTGRRKVNVNVPISLVGIGARIGAKFAAPMDLNIEEIMEVVRSGRVGKIIDVQDETDGEHVEIFVE